MAANLRHDRRVCDDREAAFLDYVRQRLRCDAAHLLTSNELKDSIEDYLKERIRCMKTGGTDPVIEPDFVKDTLNRFNFTNEITPEWPPDKKLVRALDLNGFLYHASIEKEWLEACPWISMNDKTGPDWDQTLDENLNHPSFDRRIAFIGWILDTMKECRKKQPFHPVWATFWDEFKREDLPYGSIAGSTPERWLQSLGVKKESPGRWIILLVYPARDAGRLVRPSILEAGWYPAHFPSPVPPPEAFTSRCGFCMELDSSLGTRSLNEEYIHLDQVDHDIDHWLASAPGQPMGRIGKTWSAVMPDLNFTRNSQFRKLTALYGTGGGGWMAPPC